MILFGKWDARYFRRPDWARPHIPDNHLSSTAFGGAPMRPAACALMIWCFQISVVRLLHTCPAKIRIENCHCGRDMLGRWPEILLVNIAVRANDECHNAG